jgi:hypothetical protein
VIQLVEGTLREEQSLALLVWAEPQVFMRESLYYDQVRFNLPARFVVEGTLRPGKFAGYLVDFGKGKKYRNSDWQWCSK